MGSLKCCPDPCTLPSGCINPLIHLMKRTLAYANDNVALDKAFFDVLANGITISGSSNYCCPDCEDPNGFYFLGGYNPYFEIMDSKQMTVGPISNRHPSNIVYPCCVNSTMPDVIKQSYADDFAIENILQPGAYILDKRPACCDNDFTAIVDRLLYETSSDLLINSTTGLFEASSFNGVSGITILLDFLNSLSPAVSKTYKTNIFNTIINRGIYIKCDGCDMVINFATQHTV